jgi:CBS domain containing-hemolysin-like protein
VSSEVLGWIAVVLLVLAAGVLALAETALTHLGRARAAALAEEHRRGSGALVRLLEHRERALNPVLLLLLMCHLGAATIIAVIARSHFGAVGVLIAFVIELAVIFVLAEAVPKIYALIETDRAALAVAPFVQGLSHVLPLRWLTRMLIGFANVLVPGRGRRSGPTVSEEELLALAGVAAQDSVIDAEERVFIESVLDFGDTVVREVMVPRPDMVTVSADFRVTDAVEVVILNGFSRLPVSGASIDDIVGIAYAKDLMRAERDGRGEIVVSDLMRPPQFVPETKRVAEMLREMQTQKFHLAIVIDEYGGTAGLVTLEDLIEELVGEIADEYDVDEQRAEHLDDGSLRVDASMNLDEVNDLLGAELPEGDWDTVGGLLFGLLGHVPFEGESVDADGYRLRAERVQGRRIRRVRITPVEPAPAAGTAAATP